ncbi:MAG: glycosyltransferase family 2 protein [Thermoanaerobaculia bacterium]|nr:MAG: glycosyltransferase family 2 protein [Thermoanaerobaculia bacterium]
MAVDLERRDRVRVVVRALNEAPTLGAVLSALVDAGYGVVVVDDGSADETPRIAREHPVLLVRHPINLGPGAALQTGLTAALRAGARFIVTFDADGQHACADIPALLAPLAAGDADVVFGSRFLRREDRQRVPFGRRTLLRAAVAVNGVLTGVWLTDAHNGLRAFTREAAERIRLRERGFAYASELLPEIGRHALRLVEVPVTVTYSSRSLAKGQRGWNAVHIVLDYLIGKVLR